jgi:hypothetical protein
MRKPIGNDDKAGRAVNSEQLTANSEGLVQQAWQGAERSGVGRSVGSVGSAGLNAAAVKVTAKGSSVKSRVAMGFSGVLWVGVEVLVEPTHVAMKLRHGWGTQRVGGD